MRLIARAMPMAAVLASLLAILPPSPAAGHAAYASSSPGRGEQLAVAPAQVEITFTQGIENIPGTYDIAVNKDRGSNVTAGPAVASDDDGADLSVPLLPDLADGRYVVNWKNVSDADGDPREGAFSFYLNRTPTAVDLANDAALERIGNEAETPTPSDTPQATPPPADEPTASMSETSEATPTTGAPDGGGEGSDEGGVSMAIVVIVGVAAAAAAAGGALFYFRSRSVT